MIGLAGQAVIPLEAFVAGAAEHLAVSRSQSLHVEMQSVLWFILAQNIVGARRIACDSNSLRCIAVYDRGHTVYLFARFNLRLSAPVEKGV